MYAQETVRLGLFALASIAGITLRLWLAARGHNYDMESWTMTADLVVEGRNVYANTFRHPYGPPWFLILGRTALGSQYAWPGAAGTGVVSLVVAAFLSLADIGIGWLLYRAAGLMAALFFILNPVSIILTGYHSQIDSLAILPALAAWTLLSRTGQPLAEVPWRALAGSAALLGLSLSVKHVLIFFPIWIVFSPRVVGGIARRTLYCCITYAVLVATFLPFVFMPRAWNGVREYVIGYEGMANRTLLLHVIDLFAPPGVIDTFFGTLPEILLRRLFIVLMLLAGWFIARIGVMHMLCCYLLSMVVFTYSMADQYLAIPLVACAVHWRRWESWVYLIPTTLLLYWAAADAGELPPPQPRWYAYGTGLSYQHAQVWLAVLLSSIVLWPGRRRRAREQKVGLEL